MYSYSRFFNVFGFGSPKIKRIQIQRDIDIGQTLTWCPLPFVRLTWYELNSWSAASILHDCLSKGKNAICKLHVVVKSERILKKVLPVNSTKTLTLLNQSSSRVLVALKRKRKCEDIKAWNDNDMKWHELSSWEVLRFYHLMSYNPY